MKEIKGNYIHSHISQHQMAYIDSPHIGNYPHFAYCVNQFVLLSEIKKWYGDGYFGGCVGNVSCLTLLQLINLLIKSHCNRLVAMATGGTL